MKGQIISQEFNKMAWVQDDEGVQYACYMEQNRDVRNIEDLSQQEKHSCMNLNTVLGDSW